MYASERPIPLRKKWAGCRQKNVFSSENQKNSWTLFLRQATPFLFRWKLQQELANTIKFMLHNFLTQKMKSYLSLFEKFPSEKRRFSVRRSASFSRPINDEMIKVDHKLSFLRRFETFLIEISPKNWKMRVSGAVLRRGRQWSLERFFGTPPAQTSPPGACYARNDCL